MKLAILVFLLGTNISAFAEAVCARGPVTLRKGPGSNFEKTWSVSKYMPFVRLDQKNGWAKLSDVDGEIHYARSGEFTNAIRCVVVKSNNTETRQGPGPQFPYGEFKTLDKYTPLKRLDNKDKWVQVETDLGQRVWVPDAKVWKPVLVQSVHF